MLRYSHTLRLCLSERDHLYKPVVEVLRPKDTHGSAAVWVQGTLVGARDKLLLLAYLGIPVL